MKRLFAGEPKANRSQESPGGECAKELERVIPDWLVIASCAGVIEAPEIENFGVAAIDEQRPGGGKGGEKEPARKPQIVADALDVGGAEDEDGQHGDDDGCADERPFGEV